jgi:hypothetical protein
MTEEVIYKATSSFLSLYLQYIPRSRPTTSKKIW